MSSNVEVGEIKVLFLGPSKYGHTHSRLRTDLNS